MAISGIHVIEFRAVQIFAYFGAMLVMTLDKSIVHRVFGMAQIQVQLHLQ